MVRYKKEFLENTLIACVIISLGIVAAILSSFYLFIPYLQKVTINLPLRFFLLQVSLGV
jgi:hypothetical protein